MHVIAAPGLRVPQEDNPRAHITESPSVDVPLTAYYVRRLAAGELIDVPEPVVPADAAPPAEDKPARKGKST